MVLLSGTIFMLMLWQLMFIQFYHLALIVRRQSKP